MTSSTAAERYSELTLEGVYFLLQPEAVDPNFFDSL